MIQGQGLFSTFMIKTCSTFQSYRAMVVMEKFAQTVKFSQSMSAKSINLSNKVYTAVKGNLLKIRCLEGMSW